MPKRLDYRFKLVAEIRQVGISTARSWRDGENQKWFKALEDIEKQAITAKRRPNLRGVNH